MIEKTPEEFSNYWLEKYQSYVTLADDLEAKVNHSKLPAQFKGALADVIGKFVVFADAQFKTFLDGFTYDLLEHSDEAPKDYVLQKILGQISNDLTVFEQIVDDWDGASSKNNPLRQATVLANHAFQLAYDNGFLTKKPTPLIYLHKSPVIRVIPYAGAALIGIPYTAVNQYAANGTNFRGLLAIPHEVGHFVYWNGIYDKKPIHEYLDDQLRGTELANYAHWVQEIFADIYSAFVGGSVTAYSMQEILIDNRPIFFDLDDGVHPPNVIRPYVYAYADAANQQAIMAHWEQFLTRRNIAKAFKRAVIRKDSNRRIESLDFEEITFGENATLDGLRIIENLVNVITPIFQNTTNQGSRWVNSVFSPNVYQELQAQINDPENNFHISNFENANMTWEVDPPETYAKFENARNSLISQLESVGKQQAPVPIDVWANVFLALGWTNGGEEDGYHTIE